MALLKSLFKGPKVRPSGTQFKTTNILRIYLQLIFVYKISVHTFKSIYQDRALFRTLSNI